LLPGGYWFVRNWVGRDNPLPWFGLHAGPLSFSRSIDESGTSLVDVASRDLWHRVYWPGLSEGYGVLWLLVVGLFGLSFVLPLVQRNRAIERILGLAVLVGGITYFFTPLTGGPGFVYNLRYVAPAMLIGFAMLPYALEHVKPGTRAFIGGAGAALALLDVVVTPGRLLPAWPPDYVAAGILATLALLLVAALVGLALRAGRVHIRPVVALAVVVIVVLGWPVQRRFLDRRYVDAGLEQDVAYEYFRHVRGARVGVFGTLTYPMFGVDLSNVVDQEVAPAHGSDALRCRQTRAMLARRYDYVVLTPIGGFDASRRPRDRWFANGATEVARDRAVVVYRIDGPLGPDGCA
jgi:hypothetical protein